MDNICIACGKSTEFVYKVTVHKGKSTSAFEYVNRGVAMARKKSTVYILDGLCEECGTKAIMWLKLIKPERK